MRYVEVAGARVSAIGVGTWQFGSREWGYGDDYADNESVAIVRRALDLGINLVDTAEIYGFGRSERIVGRAVAGRRDEAFLATKLFPVMPLGPVVRRRGRASAHRLDVATIDLYQVHWPNPLFPPGSTMAGMRALRDSGLINHVGVSNYSLSGWQSAERSLGGPILSNQVQFSLVARRPERDLLGHAADNDRLVIAYSPLAQGLLSGRYGVDNRPTSGVRAANPSFLPENLRRSAPLLQALAQVADAHGATSAQIALAWVIGHPNVVAIPGASSVGQLEANAAAADIDLTDEEFSRLTAASDAYRPVKGPSAALRLAAQRFRS